jgi:hypothetical protein
MAPEQKTIWINKTPASKHLSRSEGAEKTEIFSHVQRTVHTTSAYSRNRRELSGGRDPTGESKYRPRFVEPVLEASRFSSASSYTLDGTRTSSVVGLQYSLFRNIYDTNCNAINLPNGGENSDAQKSPIAEDSAIVTSRRPWPHRHDPFCRIFEPCDSPDSLKELTFLQFFREKTAVEWSGWHDKHFWQRIAPQLATSHPVVRHALVSLGAFHASFEAEEESTVDTYRALSLKQAAKSISCFNRDYGVMSMTAVFIASIALTAMASCIDTFTFLQTMRVQFDLMDQTRSQMTEGVSNLPRSDWHFVAEYLEPLIERQRSREGRLLDLMYVLSVAPATEFYMPCAPNVPDAFDSLWQARQMLEDTLKWITYTVKTQNFPVNYLPVDAEYLVLRWLQALEDFRQNQLLTEERLCSWYALRISCRMAVMMIRTMHAHSEMVFDQYHDEFRELLAAFCRVLKLGECKSRTNIRFGIDSGFVTLVFNAARWCRDPVLRRQLIASLAAAHRTESGESSYVSATTAQCYQNIEEKGIDPPPRRSDDICAERRIRPFGISFHCKKKSLRIQFLRAPYDPTHDVEEVWIPHVEDNTQIQYAAIPERKGLQPDFLLGRGFASYLVDEKASEYYTVSQCRFYFSIPRV